jgi:hypothetical protein
MKDNLGSEVHLGAETLSEVNLATTNLLRALGYNWSASQCWQIVLCRTRIWGITKDGQGYHHLRLPLNHGIRGKRR